MTHRDHAETLRRIAGYLLDGSRTAEARCRLAAAWLGGLARYYGPPDNKEAEFEPGSIGNEERGSRSQRET